MKKILSAFFISASMLAGSGVFAVAAPTTNIPPTQIAAKNDINSVFDQAKTAAKVTVSADSVPIIIGAVIKVILGIMGIVLLIILLYAGTKWMTAEGDKAKVEKARGMITTAVIGLIIVLSSYAIAYFVVESLKPITGVK